MTLLLLIVFLIFSENNELKFQLKLTSLPFFMNNDGQQSVANRSADRLVGFVLLFALPPAVPFLIHSASWLRVLWQSASKHKQDAKMQAVREHFVLRKER